LISNSEKVHKFKGLTFNCLTVLGCGSRIRAPFSGLAPADLKVGSEV
jgi:hypothetical protein